MRRTPVRFAAAAVVLLLMQAAAIAVSVWGACCETTPRRAAAVMECCKKAGAAGHLCPLMRRTGKPPASECRILPGCLPGQGDQAPLLGFTGLVVPRFELTIVEPASSVAVSSVRAIWRAVPPPGPPPRS